MASTKSQSEGRDGTARVVRPTSQAYANVLNPTLLEFCAVSNPIDELLRTPIPDKLWYYTSIKGFHGIVESKKMWATDARYLNDREELIHAEQFADKLLEAAPELDDEGFPHKDWLTKARRMAPVRGIQIFVACFTTEEDQLSQWRAYSHESSGVSLAFDLRSVRPPVGDDTSVAFAPCIYSGKTTTTLVKEERCFPNPGPLPASGGAFKKLFL